MRLVLFDIDGTLMDSGGAGTRAMDMAFGKMFSVDNAFRGIGMAGRTDLQIMKEGLLKHNIPVNGNLEEMIDMYIGYLRDEINNDRKHLKPGIYEVLGSLSSYAGIRLGLLTGNLEAGARIKLEPFGLNRYFPSGAFGSDDEDRDRLLPVAKRRFEEICGEAIGFGDCVVIGDTPRDVHCSKPYGAMAVGVATGPYPSDALREAGADYVFEDLSRQTALLEIFSGAGMTR